MAVAATVARVKFLIHLAKVVRDRPFLALGATGILGATTYKIYREQKHLEEDAKKKKVLVLPFHRMKIVEEKKSPMSALLSNLTESIENGGSGAEKVIEMQADELVSLIKEAATDPSIESMYGVFGNGGTISTGGWAHLEEIRNALESFAKNSNQSSETDDTKPKGKAMYVYSNTFGGQRSMQEYYLASVFQQIHLQPQGDLNLYGLHTTNFFIRNFLKKYGITVDVWKHGAYKNMANIFTHSKYSKEHYENTAGILLPIHKHVCKAIYTSRHHQLKKYGYNFGQFWSMIENAGSLPADVAHQIGFVDHLPLKNPLDALLKNNNPEKGEVGGASNETESSSTDATKAAATDESADATSVQTIDIKEAKECKVAGETETENDIERNSCFVDDAWKCTTHPDGFTADSKISIDAYARQRSKLRKKESNIGVMNQFLSLLGQGDEDTKEVQEKIAVVKVSGPIGETVARKAEKALRDLKEREDVKCVVLRVDSPGGSINACESIYQEIQDIPQKVVVSFGNVSASGGYYISSNAQRIFASPTTITGSIGVVMLRMDFQDLAKRYGITFDSVPTSAFSGSNDPFFPLNKQMDENYANQADRSYHRFKSVVSNGRNLSMKAVEKIAQGRVWTGEQAHQVGLVDELGGLAEAVDYAQQNYTTSGDAKVVNWPPKKSFRDLLSAIANGFETSESIEDFFLPDSVHVALSVFANGTSSWAPFFSRKSGTNAGFPLLGNGFLASPSVPVTSGVMLTVDENAGIQCMLEDANMTKAMFPLDDPTNGLP